MMVEILKVSREVADAIEKLSDLDASQILMAHAIEGGWPQKTNALSELSMEQLATALIVGYEVEMTPHEEIAVIYKRHYPKSRVVPGSTEKYFSKGYVKGIKFTLGKLGITIEGVNDNG
ncbi:MAG TPA: hypothetical protein VIH12_02370 [Solibacillus sp.]